MKRKREEDVEIMNSLFNEGFRTPRMPDGQMDQGYFSRHFAILAGLCDFIEKSVSCKSTNFVDKLVMVRDLLTRLELKLKSIDKVPDFIISELYKMTQSCYEQDLESILSSLQIVKMENKNQENKVASRFKVSNIHEGVDGAISSYWEDYLSQLKEKWKAKHVLFYLNENKALKADVERKLLYDKGLISKKLFDDLKKFEEWGYYYPIINGVLYEAGFSSPLDNFYSDHFDGIDEILSSIEEECVEESTFDSVNKEIMLELLKTLKEYTDLVCGSVVCGDVIKMTKSFEIGDLDR